MKAFYYNLKLTVVGLESRFKDHVIKLDYTNFNSHFGFKSSSMNVYVAKSYKYDRIEFAQSISKFVFGYHLDVENFKISQIKF